MNYIYDIFVVIIFVGFLLFGYHRGLLRTLLRLVNSIFALVISFILVNPFTSLLLEQNFFAKRAGSLSGHITADLIAFSDEMLLPLTKLMPDKWARAIFMQSGTAKDTIATELANATAHLFISAVAFVILYFVLRLLLSFVIRLFNGIVERIPVIASVNRLGGLLLGALFGLLMLSFVTMILTALAIDSSFLRSVLEPSRLLQFFADNDIFMSLLDTVL